MILRIAMLSKGVISFGSTNSKSGMVAVVPMLILVIVVRCCKASRAKRDGKVVSNFPALSRAGICEERAQRS